MGLTAGVFQKVTSLWQRDVQRILIRTSQALGGATSTSSITRGSPAFLAIAAVGDQHSTRTTCQIRKIYLQKLSTQVKDYAANMR